MTIPELVLAYLAVCGTAYVMMAVLAAVLAPLAAWHRRRQDAILPLVPLCRGNAASAGRIPVLRRAHRHTGAG